MTTTTRDTELDVWLAAGVIVAGTATLSFTASRQLATACGFTGWLAWVWPLCLDAVAYVATRTWLSRRVIDRVKRYGRGLALTAITGSLAANALNLYLRHADATPSWLVVLVVGAVPPAMLAAVIHMLVIRRDRDDLEAIMETVADTAPDEPSTDTTPVIEDDPPLATVTPLAGDAPTWLTPAIGLAGGIRRYLDDHPDATSAELHLHVGRHLDATPATTRATAARVRRAARDRAAGGE